MMRRIWRAAQTIECCTEMAWHSHHRPHVAGMRTVCFWGLDNQMLRVFLKRGQLSIVLS
ncbi:hypothetical protein [Cupriavidus sp. 2SB]|uniref:hypothetical protein n=1 Tax=Cupriavidus sp. 2SB TaxID=2502199 RepID=UPI0014851966|nr:hypothetical protein [Cupriavidus sp. 2SB]